MFCVIYHFKVKAGQQSAFQEAWHAVTEDMVQNFRSLGARLHSSEDGSFVAYAQWPDRESWQSGHIVIEAESKQMHVENLLDEIPTVIYKMTVIDDLFAGASPGGFI